MEKAITYYTETMGLVLAAREKDGRVVREGGLNNIDSISITSAISAVTECLGLVATLSTTYNEPYYIAERFASLDHISNGRAGWNIITTANDDAAYNFGQKSHMEKTRRYERAKEFIDICKALWASAEPDAFIWDRKTGVVADPSKVREINHVGRFFSVKGPLQCSPSPQGRPVLIQAGGSPRGINASAHFADYIFGAGKPLPLKVKHRRELDAALTAEGRDPSQIGILWDIVLVVGETEAEAQRRKEMLLTAIPPEAAGAIEDASDTPEVSLQKKDKSGLLRKCLEQLSREHREVIDLVYYHEKSIEEVAEIVGIPEATVKTRMFYARKKLSELLKAAGLDRGWP